MLFATPKIIGFNQGIVFGCKLIEVHFYQIEYVLHGSISLFSIVFDQNI